MRRRTARHDAAFYAGRLIAEKAGVSVYPVWAGPTPAPVSKTAPPPFFALRPPPLGTANAEQSTKEHLGPIEGDGERPEARDQQTESWKP